MVKMVTKKKKMSATLVVEENRQKKEKYKHTEEYTINLEPNLTEMDRSFFFF